MNSNDIHILFEYNYWALARILNAALQVTDEQFSASNTSSYGSLRGTLVHAFKAERNWRLRLQGEKPVIGPLTDDEYSTPQSLKQAWDEEEAVMRGLLSTLTDESLNSLFEVSFRGGQTKMIQWYYLMQLITHGTQHRAEAAAMLTDFNHSPGDVDMILFLREKGL